VCAKTVSEPEKIRRLYSQLAQKIRADEVAMQMYEDGVLQLTELNDIQNVYSHNDVRSAEILLNIVLARPDPVFSSFINALEMNNQLDAYLLLIDDGLCKYRFLDIMLILQQTTR